MESRFFYAAFVVVVTFYLALFSYSLWTGV